MRRATSVAVEERTQYTRTHTNTVQSDRTTWNVGFADVGGTGSGWLELFISDDYHILTWFFRVEVTPLLISRLFLLKLGCVGQKTNRVYKLSCASLQLQSWRPCDFAAQVLPCVAVHASEGCIT